MNREAFTILIVDDEEEILRTLRSYLVLNGFKVLTASSGKEALEIVKNEKIHVMLTDVSMPTMSGIALLEEVHAMDFSIQIIIMTGYSTFDITLKALELGATDYILKPFEDLDKIVHLIDLSLEKLTRWRKVLAGSSKGRG